MKAKDATLTADVVSTLTVTAAAGTSFRSVRVVSTGDEVAYYTLDGSTPTVGGDDCGMIPASGAVIEPLGWQDVSFGSVTLKVISSGTPTISLEAA